MRSGYRDEEPDFDELPPLTEAAYASLVKGTCERCGQEGHEGKDCPTITPVLLKPWDDPDVLALEQRRIRARQHRADRRDLRDLPVSGTEETT